MKESKKNKPGPSPKAKSEKHILVQVSYYIHPATIEKNGGIKDFRTAIRENGAEFIRKCEK